MVPHTQPFDEHAAEYDSWFKENALVYRSELEAVRALLPEHHNSLEVGVGTGRFARPLGIATGVEPSRAMADLARSRGVNVVEAAAEELPFGHAVFDLVLMVTTVCFLDDVGRAFSEAYRVLAAGGHFVVGFLDRETKLGRAYEARKADSEFYRWARFNSSEEVLAELTRAGFRDLTSIQTIFSSPSEMQELSPVEPGHGVALFVVMRGRKLPHVNEGT
jgi:SAM-dependent methyltransferase